jgi:formate-dependent nitrite reductase membrane component NrfD
MSKPSKRTSNLVAGILCVIGLLLLTKALLGMFGMWTNFLPMLSERLQESPGWVIGVMVGGGLCLFFGFDLLRTKK